MTDRDKKILEFLDRAEARSKLIKEKRMNSEAKQRCYDEIIRIMNVPAMLDEDKAQMIYRLGEKHFNKFENKN